MTKIKILFLFLIIPCFAFAEVGLVYHASGLGAEYNVSGLKIIGPESTCNGTDYWEGNPGATEAFEYGTDDFCTVIKDGVDWSITESDATINTYDSAHYKNGGYSLSVSDNNDLDEDAIAYIRADITDDGDFSISLWVRTPESYSGLRTTIDYFRILYFDAMNVALDLQFFTDSLEVRFGGEAGNQIDLTAGTWYKLNVDINKNAASTCMLYSAAEVLLDTITKSSTPNVDVTRIDLGWRNSNHPDSWTGTLYFDDIILNTDGD
jgi:hypothetical protein